MESYTATYSPVETKEPEPNPEKPQAEPSPAGNFSESGTEVNAAICVFVAPPEDLVCPDGPTCPDAECQAERKRQGLPVVELPQTTIPGTPPRRVPTSARRHIQDRGLSGLPLSPEGQEALKTTQAKLF